MLSALHMAERPGYQCSIWRSGQAISAPYGGAVRLSALHVAERPAISAPCRTAERLNCRLTHHGELRVDGTDRVVIRSGRSWEIGLYRRREMDH